jgi:hypothetical protein
MREHLTRTALPHLILRAEAEPTETLDAAYDFWLGEA